MIAHVIGRRIEPLETRVPLAVAMRVQIRLADLSLFPGVRELLIAGHRSSLDMANYRLLVEDSSIKEVAEYQSGRVANSDLVKF